MPVRKKRKPTRKKKSKGLSLQVKAVLIGLALILLSPFYYGYILKFAASTWGWVKNIGDDPDYPSYESYDIRIPKKYSVHGIDVSYYQGKIDWQKVKSMNENGVQISFAFIKATEGVMLVDRYFQRNWREAPKVGIRCGAYHFFRPKKSGRWQAKFFLQTVDVEKGDLPPVVDIEELNGVKASKMREELKEYVRYIENKTGVKPIIYTGLSFYNDYLRGYFDDCPLWIAHYYKAKLKIAAETKWHFWQHSDKARVNGISHVVDFNVFNGDSTEFKKLLIR
ncbi:MAG: glycoside hydrolase family 25 protein [Sphingobacteriaceae bacterium]|nr:glycoside hydrolase family 25 protein [Sphingobacteriaceae bacterium]